MNKISQQIHYYFSKATEKSRRLRLLHKEHYQAMYKNVMAIRSRKS